MKNAPERMCRTREFAERAGVTVRTLHHYDRLGLLKPSGRTLAGYRLYGEKDLARLQQVLTLKFIGLPLKQIKGLLGGRTFDLAETLRLQREVVQARRRQLDLALAAIERAERTMDASGAPDWEALKKIVEVIDMGNHMEWTKKYYGEETQAKLAARREAHPGLAEQGQRDWAALIAEVEQALRDGVDPASDKAQALAARWQALIESFTGGDPQIAAGLRKLYADQANWPSTFKKPFSDEVGAFIGKANAARNK
jgi:DNA-binding transcriptional MerR regulator